MEDFKLIRLEPDTEILPFDCADDDLNGFLFDDAKDYAKNLMAVTYLLQSKDATIAYFSYQNDKISHTDIGNIDTFRERIGKLLPLEKSRHKSYPAVKIGRLAVTKSTQVSGIGTKIIQFTKQYFVDKNKTGCKFITVDAYRDSLGFYKKMGFKCLSSKDKKSDTRLMYFNLEALSS